ncbi:YrhB domain-containing protein, partial [Streptomyces umbrinus]
MISKERAVELVESLLAAERLTWAGPVRELAVYGVEEHAVGWLVFWNSAEYARTRDLRDNLVGNGPYLVDRYDGSIHHIPSTTWVPRFPGPARAGRGATTPAHSRVVRRRPGSPPT